MPAAFADVAETVFYAEDVSSPLTILRPAAFGPGQILVLVLTADGGHPSDLTAPSGWTLGANSLDGIGQAGRVWSHVYDGLEPSTWDFGYRSVDSIAAVLFRLTHVDVTTPTVTVPIVGLSNSNTGSLDSASLSPASNNDVLLVINSNQGSGNTFSVAAPTGTTDLGSTQVVGGYQALKAAKEQLVSPGDTGVRSWTSILPTGTAAGAFAVAVKDSGAFDPDPPRIPPLPTVSEALLNDLLTAKARRYEGSSGSAYVQERLSAAASGVATTLTTAAGTEVGDLLVCVQGNNFYTAAGMTAPTGTAGSWTLEATGDGGTNGPHLKAWTRQVTVAGPQTVTVAPVSDEEIWQHLLVIRGHDTTDPTDDAAGSSGAASTSHVAPSVTPTSSYPLLVCAVQGGTTAGSYTPPGAPQQMVEVTDLSLAGFGVGSLASQVLGVTTTATGTRTFTCSASQAYASVSLAIRSPDVTVGGETNCPAEDTSATAAAQDAALDIAPGAENALVTDAALDPGVLVGASAENALASASALDATISAVSGTNAPAEVAATTGLANDTTLTISASAENAPASAVALDAALRISPNAEAASVTAAVLDPGLSVSVNTEVASATASALDATVSTAAFTNASAENVQSADTAQDASLRVAPSAEDALAVAAAQDATFSATGNASAESAPVAASANDASIRISVSAELVSITAAAQDATAATATVASAESAGGTATANDATVRLSVSAEVATVSDASLDASAGTSGSTPAENALASAAALNATVAVTIPVFAQSADATGAAQDPALRIALAAAVAAALAEAYDVEQKPVIGRMGPYVRTGPVMAPAPRAGAAMSPVERSAPTMVGVG